MAKVTIVDGNEEIELSTAPKENIKAFMVKGEPGSDGVSPTVSVSKTDGTATINITDKDGTKSTSIDDGFSPIVDVSKENRVTTLTITDAEGTETVEIPDGIDLTGGVPTNGVIGFDITELIYTCDGTETGDYYFTYNNVDYYFTMPTVEDGDVLVFNTTNLTLKLDNTTITTSSSGTGTQLTFTNNIPNGYEETTEPFPGSGGGGSGTVHDNYSSSTTEPYSANYVNNHSVTVSEAEPTNKTKVWIKESGNLFDSSNANILNALLRTSDNTLYASASERTLYIACLPNTTYRITKTAGARFRVDERQNTPTINSSNVNLVVMDSAKEYVYTTSANGNYLLLNYYTTSESGTEQDMLNSISIEVVPSINVLEDSVYKEIYNKPVVLYDNETGLKNNIPLSDSAPNYEYIEVFGKINDYICSAKTYTDKISLTSHYKTSNATHVCFKSLSISDKLLTIAGVQEWYNTWGTSNITASNDDNMYITKVIGYK